MKILIASDIHGDIDAVRKTAEKFKEEGCGKLLLLGDILYHGPRNDLPESYAPKEVIALFNAMKNDILAVRGNCDTEVDQMVLEFPILADYAYLYLDGITIFATHGHHHNTATPPPMNKGDILLHGHTHVLKIEEFESGKYYVNPGSAALPKEGNPKTYAIYENRSIMIKDFDGKIILKKEF